MFSFLPGLPGTDDLRAVVRRVDTARHHGVPDGCVLELDLMAAPGRRFCEKRSPQSTGQLRIHGSAV